MNSVHTRFSTVAFIHTDFNKSLNHSWINQSINQSIIAHPPPRWPCAPPFQRVPPIDRRTHACPRCSSLTSPPKLIWNVDNLVSLNLHKHYIVAALSLFKHHHCHHHCQRHHHRQCHAYCSPLWADRCWGKTPCPCSRSRGSPLSGMSTPDPEAKFVIFRGFFLSCGKRSSWYLWKRRSSIANFRSFIMLVSLWYGGFERSDGDPHASNKLQAMFIMHNWSVWNSSSLS